MSLVVFHNHGGHPLDRFLKEDFKHVFCAVQEGDYWITVDGQDGLPSVKVVAASSYDLKTFYEDEGYTVIEIERGSALNGPFLINNCVGMVKVTLGIHALFVVTPYQLFKYLRGKHV